MSPSRAILAMPAVLAITAPKAANKIGVVTLMTEYPNSGVNIKLKNALILFSLL